MGVDSGRLLYLSLASLCVVATRPRCGSSLLPGLCVKLDLEEWFDLFLLFLLFYFVVTEIWDPEHFYAFTFNFSSVQSLSRVRLCDPMSRSTPGLPVHHRLWSPPKPTPIASVMPTLSISLQSAPFFGCTLMWPKWIVFHRTELSALRFFFPLILKDPLLKKLR